MPCMNFAALIIFILFRTREIHIYTQRNTIYAINSIEGVYMRVNELHVNKLTHGRFYVQSPEIDKVKIAECYYAAFTLLTLAHSRRWWP